MTKKNLEDLQTRIDEALDVVESIQGGEFRNLLAFVAQSTQIMKLVAKCRLELKDEMLGETLYMEVAKTLARASSMLADAYKIEEEKVDELTKWVETLEGHVNNFLKENRK